MASANMTCSSPASTQLVGMRNSPFNTLPPELRNNIWELVFHRLWRTTTLCILRRRHIGSCSSSHKLALLLICKQIHQEAQGYAWRRVTATMRDVEFFPCEGDDDYLDDDDDEVDEERDANDTTDSLIINSKCRIDAVLRQLAARLPAITSLHIQHLNVLEFILAQGSRTIVSDGAMKRMLLSMRSLRRVTVYDDAVYNHHCVAVLFKDDRSRYLRTCQDNAKCQLIQFRRSLPMVRKLTIREGDGKDDEDGHISWQISQTGFFNTATSTRWPVKGR